jgi:hypothetical protein
MDLSGSICLIWVEGPCAHTKSENQPAEDGAIEVNQVKRVSPETSPLAARASANVADGLSTELFGLPLRTAAPGWRLLLLEAGLAGVGSPRRVLQSASATYGSAERRAGEANRHLPWNECRCPRHRLGPDRSPEHDADRRRHRGPAATVCRHVRSLPRLYPTLLSAVGDGGESHEFCVLSSCPLLLLFRSGRARMDR